MSESFPAIGVITAPVMRYAESIQDDILYGTLNSFMSSANAGINIVSAYMTIVARLLRTASTFHADIGIFVVGGPPGLSSKVPKQMSPRCPCNGLNYLIKR